MQAKYNIHKIFLVSYVILVGVSCFMAVPLEGMHKSKTVTNKPQIDSVQQRCDQLVASYEQSFKDDDDNIQRKKIIKILLALGKEIEENLDDSYGLNDLLLVYKCYFKVAVIAASKSDNTEYNSALLSNPRAWHSKMEKKPALDASTTKALGTLLTNIQITEAELSTIRMDNEFREIDKMRRIEERDPDTLDAQNTHKKKVNRSEYQSNSENKVEPEQSSYSTAHRKKAISSSSARENEKNPPYAAKGSFEALPEDKKERQRLIKARDEWVEEKAFQATAKNLQEAAEFYLKNWEQTYSEKALLIKAVKCSSAACTKLLASITLPDIEMLKTHYQACLLLDKAGPKGKSKHVRRGKRLLGEVLFYATSQFSRWHRADIKELCGLFIEKDQKDTNTDIIELARSLALNSSSNLKEMWAHHYLCVILWKYDSKVEAKKRWINGAINFYEEILEQFGTPKRLKIMTRTAPVASDRLYLAALWLESYKLDTSQDILLRKMEKIIEYGKNNLGKKDWDPGDLARLYRLYLAMLRQNRKQDRPNNQNMLIQLKTIKQWAETPLSQKDVPLQLNSDDLKEISDLKRELHKAEEEKSSSRESSSEGILSKAMRSVSNLFQRTTSSEDSETSSSDSE